MDALDKAICNLIQMMTQKLQPCYKDFVPIDLDVSPLDNFNSHKKGMSCTYKCFDGYVLILKPLRTTNKLSPRGQDPKYPLDISAGYYKLRFLGALLNKLRGKAH